MKKVETIISEECRAEIAYKRQALKELHGNIPEVQYQEQKELWDKEIKKLGGKEILIAKLVRKMRMVILLVVVEFHVKSVGISKLRRHKYGSNKNGQ